MSSVAVIGGGPAGIMAAAMAAQNGHGDRILVFSARPARIKAEHRVELSRGSTPLERRNSPEFKDYFDAIWKEIEHEY